MDHQFYHRILDHLPNIVCVVQNDGNLYNLLYGNLLFYQMMNSQDEIHRVHPHRSFTQEFIHGEDLNKFLAARSILLHSGQVSTDIGACRTLCFLGNHRFYQTMTWNMTMNPSSRDYLVLSGQVYTSDKDEQNGFKESQFIDFFQNGPIPLHWLSNTGHIIWANDVELETLGYTRDEYLGHHILEFCPEESVKLTTLYSKLNNGETVHDVVFKFQTKTGETKFLLFDSNVNQDSEGNFRHIRCFLRDETKRHLNDRMLEHQRKVTQNLLKVKDAYLRRIIHEIKAPLKSSFDSFKHGDNTSHVFQPAENCTFSIDLASSVLPKHGDVDHAMHVKAAKFQILRISRVLENIACAQQYQNDHQIQVSHTHLHIPTILRKIVSQVTESELKQGHQLALQVHLDVPTIRTDKMIQCVFYNLIANAIQYSPNDSLPHQIIFKMTTTTPSDDSKTKVINHKFTITNTFPPPIDITELSRRFHVPALSAGSVTSDSIGLGLFVSSQIIQNLGGVIECHCDGTEITFQFSVNSHSDLQNGHNAVEAICPSLEDAVTWIPMTPKHDDEVISRHLFQLQEPSSTAHNCECHHSECHRSKRPRYSDAFDTPSSHDTHGGESDTTGTSHLLLVVEDSTLCQKIVSKLLSSFGFRCDVANNGYEAVEKLKSPSCGVDAVLMDLRMPVMDGLTAITEIRKYPHLQHLPIIVTTAEHGNDIQNEVFRVGGNHFLSKPIKRRELLMALQRYIPLLNHSCGE